LGSYPACNDVNAFFDIFTVRAGLESIVEFRFVEMPPAASPLPTLRRYRLGSALLAMNAPAKPSHFSQLGRMLGWSPRTKVMTLWAMFDESGWHPTKGPLAKLTVAGCIASFDDWEALSLDWSDAIAKMGISCFHMTDFEARRYPYDGWTNAQRKDRLNSLLNIIGGIGPHCCGFTNSAKPGETTASIYERCAQDVLLGLDRYDDEFAIVFAHHPEFAAYSPLHQLLMKYGYGKRIKSVSIGYPVDMCPLQAADIVAFEIRCLEREEDRPERYPLKRLQQLGCSFRISASDSTIHF
jgi:hypothetical protein